MTETFDAGWLALREPLDHHSRAQGLLPRLREWWGSRGCSAVLDLGCGTGSNLRYLAPELPGAQAWTLVDHDSALLAHVAAPGRNVRVKTVQGDLADTGIAQVGHAHLVTASALLDLVSESWLKALVDACADSRCGALFALTYDGTIEWSTGTDPLDALVLDAVNAHQRRDKGLGPALGPTATETAEALFRQRGYRTWRSPSPWQVGVEEVELARVLVEGWATAAAQERPRHAADVRQWAERRQEAVAHGRLEIVVGHEDLLALPADADQAPS